MKKKLLLKTLLVSLLFCLYGCTDTKEATIEDDTKTNAESEQQVVQEKSAEEESTKEESTQKENVQKRVRTKGAHKRSAQKFVHDVKVVVKDNVGEDEFVTDVILKNKDLCVYVDFSKVDPSPFTLEDLALSRTSSITDAILDLSDYDNLWETITVDFGGIGHITNDKANMEDSEYGRYFLVENFKLE